MNKYQKKIIAIFFVQIIYSMEQGQLQIPSLKNISLQSIARQIISNKSYLTAHDYKTIPASFNLPMQLQDELRETLFIATNKAHISPEKLDIFLSTISDNGISNNFASYVIQKTQDNLFYIDFTELTRVLNKYSNMSAALHNGFLKFIESQSDNELFKKTVGKDTSLFKQLPFNYLVAIASSMSAENILNTKLLYKAEFDGINYRYFFRNTISNHTLDNTNKTLFRLNQFIENLTTDAVPKELKSLLLKYHAELVDKYNGTVRAFIHETNRRSIS
ncbi:MAG: hypothetical protein WC707_02610 [Candidatus Babeliaceae bacterium]|jgi:hypothetical protein